MEEIWKDIPGYEGLYQASNLGNIKSLRYNIILKPGKDKGGYLRVCLTDNNKKRNTLKVHRIIAITYLGYQKYKCVNHIDFNRANNVLINLEWVTQKENCNHSKCNRKKQVLSNEHKEKLLKANRIKVIDTKTGIIYESINDASIKLNIKKSTLTHYLIGSRKNKTALRYL